MSFRRHQSFAINTNNFLAGRLSHFVSPHVYYGNLFVEKNLTVYNNTDICGNLTVKYDISATNFRASGNFYLDGYVLVPAGTIIMSASVAEPDGWLHCNGRLISTIVYADLFAAIGLTYTYISAANMFQIPDMRGRVGVGSYEGSSDSTYALTQRTLGQMGGEENHTLSESEMPVHTHNYLGVQTQTAGNVVVGSTDVAENSPRPTEPSGPAGGGQAHNNMQPYAVVRYLIKY